MKKMFLMAAFAISAASYAQHITSPDGKVSVDVDCKNGQPTYTIALDGKECLKPSPLGLNTNIGDFTSDLAISKTSDISALDHSYELYNIKRKSNRYQANCQTLTLAQKGKDVLNLIFQVSNDGVAFRYEILESKKEARVVVVNSEATGYSFSDATTTFLCPQMGIMTGFARTAPSYETHYTPDDAVGKNGWGQGYTFPCLFKTEGNVWMLISEAGPAGQYPGCKIENVKGGDYKISFPSIKENNGYGTNTAQMLLPGKTPWRTIVVGDNLKPIVESTLTWDVITKEDKNLNPNLKYGDVAVKGGPDFSLKANDGKGSRGAWSWIIADDASCNFDTQKKYVDFAAAMGWETLLIDAQWDRQIGYERMAELARYAKTKGVRFYLWYNSNGRWNDAPQTPLNKMCDAFVRRQEMKWMQSVGIKGIKVDFFGGDKQCTLELYRDILLDANEYGISVIFHGCTLPRGWEAIYPNYVASEAVRASENLRFGQNECDTEAQDAAYHPFIRNSVGSMDFGGSTLNKRYSTNNDRGTTRRTSDVFALATAVLFQSPVQHFAMAPNNLTDAPAWAVDFMKTVPTTWEDIRFIDGYPGKYVILARKSAEGKWYLVGINGQKDQTVKAKVSVDMFVAGSTVNVYSDDAQLNGSVKQVKVNKKQVMEIVIPVNGGIVINN